MSGEDIKSKILSAETLIPVGVLLALLGPVIACTWWSAVAFTDFTARLDGVERAIAAKDHWTWKMERQSWVEFKQKNPTLLTPEVKQIYDDWTYTP